MSSRDWHVLLDEEKRRKRRRERRRNDDDNEEDRTASPCDVGGQRKMTREKKKKRRRDRGHWMHRRVLATAGRVAFDVHGMMRAPRIENFEGRLKRGKNRFLRSERFAAGQRTGGSKKITGSPTAIKL